MYVIFDFLDDCVSKKEEGNQKQRKKQRRKEKREVHLSWIQKEKRSGCV